MALHFGESSEKDVEMKTVVSLSNKSKNPRSIFLSALMKGLGGDTGNEVAEAFASGDVQQFKDAMAKVVDAVAEKMTK